MSSRSNREVAVRRMMEGPTLVVPAEVLGEAVRRGGRLLWWRRVARRVMWTLLFAAVVAFAVWAAVAQPWVEPPSETTPPVVRW
ncbi:hypothetical protein DF268_31090 [Streptomyces sp. V2]|uniref:Uncharacterized protein n=1 Tax=Streptomyces niveiscabiei TaxID=164115 RepID=A0ABW9I7Q4_9ACTN|nr:MULTISPECIES: hypothetical protein [Streptomyces]MDX3386574.1 hypothetical protein [Streptomyces niveiscabiei]PWG09676.1 hypothetical protein DF268_31090 [Streptomyces sp. V2]